MYRKGSNEKITLRIYFQFASRNENDIRNARINYGTRVASQAKTNLKNFQKLYQTKARQRDQGRLQQYIQGNPIDD